MSPTPNALQTLLDQAVEKGVAPAAQAAVYHRGVCVFEGAAGEANVHTVFDLSSVTKVISTTALFMALWQRGQLAPEAPFSYFFRRTARWHSDITCADLLYHRSGLPAFVPFFVPLIQKWPTLVEPEAHGTLRMHARGAVIGAALALEPSTGLRQKAVYSDVGFILLGELLSVAAHEPLDSAFETHVARALNIDIHFRRISSQPPLTQRIAPTGTTRPREPAPGQETLWNTALPTAPSRVGEVDDDNAFVMDGVSGHAGLFGTASQVAFFGQRILEELNGAGRLAHPERWRLAVQRDSLIQGSSRALGFDTPEAEGASSAGRWLGKPPGAIGHLGFTGTSLWIDLGRQLSVALCTNRTAPGRKNLGIRELRPQFHDLVVETIQK